MADASLIAGAPRSGYPPDLRTLVDGVDVTGARTSTCCAACRDPFAAPDADANGGWAAQLRSPVTSRAGDDVFDVYSTSRASA